MAASGGGDGDDPYGAGGDDGGDEGADGYGYEESDGGRDLQDVDEDVSDDEENDLVVLDPEHVRNL